MNWTLWTRTLGTLAVLLSSAACATSGSPDTAEEAEEHEEQDDAADGDRPADSGMALPDEPAEAGAIDPTDAGAESWLASAEFPYAACEAARGSGDNPLIDDFEQDDGRIASNDGRGGGWFSYDDGTNGTLSYQVEAATTIDSGTLHVVSSGWNIWGSAIATGLAPSLSAEEHCSYDASAYAGVQFRARGNGRLRLRLASVPHTPVAEGGTCTLEGEACYDWPGISVNITDQWQTHFFPFCMLDPVGWGRSENDLDLEQLVGLHFMFEGGEGLELWLDDLSFFQREQDADAGTDECRPLCPLEAAPEAAWADPEFTYLTLSEQLTLHTFEQETTSCGSLTRRYLSYVPKNLGAASDAPVLFALHGSGANAESFQDVMARGGLDELAEREGFIVVYGNAAPSGHSSNDFPNTGVWRQAFYDDGEVDDLDYLWRVLEELKARGVTSGDNPVALTGISNGGGMVLDAAKRAPDRFVGIAPFMAFDGLAPSALPDLSETTITRVLFGISSNDPGLPDGYERVLGGLPAEWAAALGLPSETVETQLPDVEVEGEDYAGNAAAALATRDSRATQIDFFAPDHDAAVRVLRFDHAGHFWPNPVQDSEDWTLDRWGFRNQDVDASEAVWEFLLGDQ
jgi:poly(3-hydroxybutyrate) depolymerase